MSEANDGTARILRAFVVEARLADMVQLMLRELLDEFGARAVLFARTSEQEGDLRLYDWNAEGARRGSYLVEALRDPDCEATLQASAGGSVLSLGNGPKALVEAMGEEDVMRAFLQSVEVEGVARFSLLILDGPVDLELATSARRDSITTILQAFQSAVVQRMDNRKNMVHAARMRDAMETAQAANEAKGHFLATMSHEIRTPMTAIVGFAHLIAGDRGTHEERKKWSRQLKRNADFLLGLVNDVLDLAKFEAGELEVNIADCSPRDALEEAYELMETQAVERGLRFEYVESTPLPDLIPCDGIRLRQLIVNLVSNAIKYTREGRVRLEASCEARFDGQEGQYLRIDVHDTGIGIAPENITKLFQNFQQVHRTDGEFSGTGLGLALVKHITERLGGWVDVESVLDEGSTFTLRLEIPSADRLTYTGRRDDEDSHRRHAEQSDENPLAGRKILVVDDNGINRKLFTTLLSHSGAEVATLTDGSEIIEAFEREGLDYDCVLMDMQMQDVNGNEATRRLRAGGCKTKIIALTALSRSKDQAECEEAGCDGFMSKPVDPGRFASQVADCIGDLPRRDQAPEQGAPTTIVKEAKSTLSGEHAELLAGIAERFIQGFDSWIHEAQGFLEGSLLDELRSHCHKVKGAAGSLGMPDVSRIAGECESVLRNGGGAPEVRDLLDELEMEMRSIQGSQAA